MKKRVGSHLGRVHLAVDRVFGSSAVLRAPVKVKLDQLVHVVAQGSAG